MDNPLLLIYAGEDNKAKLRLLSESGVGEEIPADSLNYFQEKKVYLHHGKAAFYAHYPLGAKDDPLKFRELVMAGIFSTMDGSPAYQMFNEMDQETAIDLYKKQIECFSHNAFIEKQVSVVH